MREFLFFVTRKNSETIFQKLHVPVVTLFVVQNFSIPEYLKVVNISSFMNIPKEYVYHYDLVNNSAPFRNYIQNKYRQFNIVDEEDNKIHDINITKDSCEFVGCSNRY